MRDHDLSNRFKCMIACLTCLWALATNGQNPAADEINSTLTLLRAMGWEYDRAFTGITDITEFQEPKDIAMGQEIKRRCDVDPPTRLCEEWDPREIQKTEAEAMSGRSGADLATMLRDAADGAMVAGIMLEFGVAGATPLGVTLPGKEALRFASGGTLNDILVEQSPLAARCFAASVVSTKRKGEDVPEAIAYDEDIFESNPQYSAEAYVSPIALMTEASCMLLIASRSLTTVQERAPIQSRLTSEQMIVAAEQVVYHGTELHGSDNVHRISLENPGFTETNDSGHQFTVNKMERWIHVDYLIEVKSRVSGTLAAQGENRALFIEREFGDFRRLPGTQMRHPFRTTSRIGGILSEEELEEMSEATESLDEIEQQMAAMSPRERQQMQQMLGPRINQLRTMVDSGVFEFTLITKRVLVNTDAREALSGNVVYKPELLTQEIQYNLAELGYDPGEADGQLSRETIAAIIGFERDYQLELTGRPTQELARIISAVLSATR